MSIRNMISSEFMGGCLFLATVFILVLQNSSYGAVHGFAAPSLINTADAFSTIVETNNGAVVNIFVKRVVDGAKDNTTHQDFFNNPIIEEFFGSIPEYQQGTSKEQITHKYGNGTGFIISEDGYIITNHHVVKDAVSVTVYLHDKREYEARIVGSDPKSDIALLQIKENGLPTVLLGDSDTLRVGEWAIAIGAPMRSVQTVTVGVISAKGRNNVGISEYEDFIQTDAAINPGNSGGPLFNIHGEVIGVNTAFMKQSGGYMGVGFAIPINMVKIVVSHLRFNGVVSRGWLGVSLKDVNLKEIREVLGEKYYGGAKVVEVKKGSPACKAGLKKGDFIVAVDGSVVSGAPELRNKVALTSPGSKIMVEFLRGGKLRKLDVVIGKFPVD